MADITQLLNPINILDIAIVAILIYKLISMVKGTRAVQLIKGILLLLLLSAISSNSVLGLTTVNWILEQVKTLLLIAIPIVFQPELRRGLEQLGNNGFLTGVGGFLPGGKRNKEAAEVDYVVNQLVPFLTESSSTRTGVLIALQREVGLNEYVNTGIKINGHLSSQLLGNIFIVNTPLHDGAVIIEADTILAASCYLPLSENNKISKALGTRHRAGIGLSEVSDAIVCIVSEETGAISIAQGGRLQHNIGEVALRRTLLEGLQSDAPKTFLQKWRDDHDRKADSAGKK